jgi:hypothetical protein
MATIVEPEGRMTKPLTTPYHVGDRVMLLVTERQAEGRVRVGDLGTVEEIIISDPNDGDGTFLMFYVKLARGRILLHPRDFAPAAEAETHVWARNQIKALGRGAPKKDRRAAYIARVLREALTRAGIEVREVNAALLAELRVQAVAERYGRAAAR